MKSVWQLQEAKAKLSALVDAAVSDGPQIITRHGTETVVVLSKSYYDTIRPGKKSLIDILKSAPKVDHFDVTRDSDTGRTIEL